MNLYFIIYHLCTFFPVEVVNCFVFPVEVVSPAPLFLRLLSFTLAQILSMGNGTGYSGTLSPLSPFLFIKALGVKRSEPQTGSQLQGPAGPAACALHVCTSRVCLLGCFLDFSFEIWSHFVSHVGLELVIPLPQPLQCCSSQPPSQLCMLFSVLCRLSAHPIFTAALEDTATAYLIAGEKWDTELESGRSRVPLLQSPCVTVTAQMSFSTEQCAVHICAADLCF